MSYTKESKKKIFWILILNLATALSVIYGLWLSRGDGWGLFIYYTTDSNVYLCLASLNMAVLSLMTLLGITDKLPELAIRFKYMAACTTTLTFLIVLTVLIPEFGNSMVTGAMFYLHILAPVLGILSVLTLENVTGNPWKAARSATYPTLIYAVVLAILNILKLYYGPYPFLHVYEQSILTSVLWFVGIIVGIYLISVLMFVISRKK